MATGDDAAARGMTLVAGSAPRNTIHTLINKALDYIAYYTRWGNLAEKPTSFPNDDVTAATFGGDVPGNGGKLVRFSPAGFIGVPTPTSSAHAVPKAYVDGAGTSAATADTLMRRGDGGRVSVGEPVNPGNATTKSYVDAHDDALLTLVDNALEGRLDSGVYSRTISGSTRSLYIRSDGTLGWVASSRDVKKNIRDWTPDRQAILAMQLVQFQYKVAIDTDRTGRIEHGLIAEQLDELGLEWLVDYGETGKPEGVRYDLISLALLSVAQDHEERLARLEQGE